ncbi:DUF6054 family protein [Tissierella sp. Yu-01]|uniref:DUF6054 family protein n=1 Tax=Tissierella sp. Yu-01 TaxID=3035694 RepID=UPI00240E2678|nr:DUF6054 family protein [Tissierella sp. Yu-01]WFA08246.1 DUF6054 family protein [Tissierella sp. Yu-01]
MNNTFFISISIEEAAEKIYDAVVNGSITGELIDGYEIAGHDKKCIVLVFEKHYYRAGNRLTLTVTLDDFEDNARVHYVSGGGGEGLFKFDWGASESFAEIVPSVLEKYKIK